MRRFPVIGMAVALTTISVVVTVVAAAMSPEVALLGGLSASPTPATTQLPPPSSDGDVTIAAVGAMNPSGNPSSTSASGKNAAAIAGGLADGTLTNFLALGDFQYDK